VVALLFCHKTDWQKFLYHFHIGLGMRGNKVCGIVATICNCHIDQQLVGKKTVNRRTAINKALY